MTPAHLRVVLNGKAAGNDQLRDAVQALRDEGLQVDVRVTWESGDADRHVVEALADGVGTIVSGGGDGTLCEVANALARLDAAADALPAVAVLPGSPTTSPRRCASRATSRRGRSTCCGWMSTARSAGRSTSPAADSAPR